MLELNICFHHSNKHKLLHDRFQFRPMSNGPDYKFPITSILTVERHLLIQIWLPAWYVMDFLIVHVIFDIRDCFNRGTRIIPVGLVCWNDWWLIRKHRWRRLNSIPIRQDRIVLLQRKRLLRLGLTLSGVPYQ